LSTSTKQLCYGLNNHEVIIDCSTFDGGTLVGHDKAINERCQPLGQGLSDQFVEIVDQTNCPKIPNLLHIPLLMQQHHVRLVNKITIVKIQ
jgi:hypothetical protein